MPFHPRIGITPQTTSQKFGVGSLRRLAPLQRYKRKLIRDKKHELLVRRSPSIPMHRNTQTEAPVIMSSSSSSSDKSSASPKKKHPLQHLIAGGCAGLVESSVCHPLDTIKTRMQLRRQGTSVAKSVVKMRDSLMEPALRLKHSLQEPTFKAAGAAASGLHEPALHLKAAAATPGHHTVTIKAPPANVVQASLGPIGTARRIVQREGFLALYKGLTAVYTGIIPKMAIRFVSFEYYRDLGIAWNGGQPSTSITFTAGLASGLTEAILVVTPAEVSVFARACIADRCLPCVTAFLLPLVA